MDRVILVYIQCFNGLIERGSLELLGKAEELAKKAGYTICAAAAGEEPEKMQNGLAGYPAEYLYYRQTKVRFDWEEISGWLADICRNLSAEVLLISATREGRSLAPCVSARLRTGLTADCTELTIDEKGMLLQVRPAFEEKVLACIQTSTRPQIATVRKNVMTLPTQKGRTLPILHVTAADDKDIRGGSVLSVSTTCREKMTDVSKAKVLVVLGAGIKDRNSIKLYEEWARDMGGLLACSRKLAERGWLSPNCQIGLSGNTSEAEFMVTIGVSGSIQFQAGIRRVKHLIAVNTDPEAMIMSIADEAVLLDADQLTSELEERRRRKNEQNNRTIRGKSCDSGCTK